MGNTMSLLLKILFTEIIIIFIVAFFGLILQPNSEKVRNIIMGIIASLFVIMAITLLLGTWGFI